MKQIKLISPFRLTSEFNRYDFSYSLGPPRHADSYYEYTVLDSAGETIGDIVIFKFLDENDKVNITWSRFLNRGSGAELISVAELKNVNMMRALFRGMITEYLDEAKFNTI